jgi:hypothetical protein
MRIGKEKRRENNGEEREERIIWIRRDEMLVSG